jgi:hypothetical protein
MFQSQITGLKLGNQTMGRFHVLVTYHRPQVRKPDYRLRFHVLVTDQNPQVRKPDYR